MPKSEFGANKMSLQQTTASRPDFPSSKCQLKDAPCVLSWTDGVCVSELVDASLWPLFSVLTVTELLLIDSTTEYPALPVQTQTELTVCFAALIMHVTLPAEKEKKEKPGVY
ncbi:hypothetical protein EYF80_035777 [Liparis tanakae]|uniref:Uncharacterized protein n=1 Tax=Liparis tanakae TaxID=230148 RepID=A0A4Z2GL05_9TELE|nr:hypothetical protein EYF80_035777 [Liparis tanakae]